MLKRLVLAVLLAIPALCKAQNDEFCEAVNVIVRDAPNKFRNIRGRLTEANANATMWTSGIKVPGSIGARFVAAMGLFYECAFVQTRDIKELKEAYYKYKSYLSACVSGTYTVSEQPNFYQGMGEMKKVVWMPNVDDNVKADAAPAHITLEATFRKETGQYTVVMFIFEH